METAEKPKKLTRREFLWWLTTGAGAAVLTGCLPDVGDQGEKNVKATVTAREGNPEALTFEKLPEVLKRNTIRIDAESHQGTYHATGLVLWSGESKNPSANYEIKNYFLSPDVADLGNLRSEEKLKERIFLMLEIAITDTRKSGNRMLIPVSKYLKLLEEDMTVPSFLDDYLWLSPGESKTYYAGFAVDAKTKLFTLNLGATTKPKKITIDFNKPNLEVKEGYFLLKKGFSEIFY